MWHARGCGWKRAARTEHSPHQLGRHRERAPLPHARLHLLRVLSARQRVSALLGAGLGPPALRRRPPRWAALLLQPAEGAHDEEEAAVALHLVGPPRVRHQHVVQGHNRLAKGGRALGELPRRFEEEANHAGPLPSSSATAGCSNSAAARVAGGNGPPVGVVEGLQLAVIRAGLRRRLLQRLVLDAPCLLSLLF